VLRRGFQNAALLQQADEGAVWVRNVELRTPK
jgi:hypothetical protein